MNIIKNNIQNKNHASYTNKKELFQWFSLSLLSTFKEVFISKELITNLIDSFWKEVYLKHKDEIILIQIVIRTENSDRSISKM